VSAAETEGPAAAGHVAPDVADEFPALRLRYLEVDARTGRSSRGVKHRLKEMSSRFRGPQAVAMRQEPIPWAYRVFYRHIGLDPDADRTPVEQAAVQRLIEGAFRSRNRLDDALLIALVETGVPIWALDAATVEGQLRIRVTGTGERLGRGERAPALVSGRLIVADDRSPLAVLFGDLAPGHGVSSSTTRMTLFTVQVQGVPEIHVEEALDSCVEVLTEPG
jgi:DNA/RNA-binding domain of Phe-tRNA-synthetase-like protein